MTGRWAVGHERFRFADGAALRQRIADLGVEVPWAEDVGALLAPVELAGRRLANRIVIQPMEGCDSDERGGPTELTFRRYRRYGAGGSGLIWFEATAVVGEGRSNARQLWIHEGTVEGFERLVEATRAAARERFGASREVTLVLQLTHSGRYSKPSGTARPVIARHCPELDAWSGIDEGYPVISDGELDALQDVYVGAARLAARAGVDGVDVKACNGYLVSELLASFTRQGSLYGGRLFEDRSRFLLEVIGRIREEVPQVFATSRMSGWDGIARPYGFGCGEGDPPAWDAREPRALAEKLAAMCPVLNYSIGNPYHRAHYGRPHDKAEVARKVADEHPLVGVERLIRIGAELQEAAGNVPVVGTGYSWLREHFPHVAAGAIESGGAKLAGVGRLAFAYPDAAADLAEKGVLDPKKVCITCSSCTQIMRDGGRTGCVLRDAEVYGREYREGRQRAKMRGRAEES